MKDIYKRDDYFAGMAEYVSQKSKDPSTKVGAVIVGPDDEVRSTGYNDLPRGVQDDIPERRQRPEKYLWVCHAEANAVFNAARSGIATNGCRLYLNFFPTPCADCAKALIQAGITEIIGPNEPFPGKGEQWEESLRVSGLMLDEAGVKRSVLLTDRGYHGYVTSKGVSLFDEPLQKPAK